MNGKPLPSTNYQEFYQTHNNPYTQYDSGYGVDDSYNQSNVDYENQQREMTSNCVRLSEVSYFYNTFIYFL